MKETDYNYILEQGEPIEKMPRFLLVLLILTFINTGLALLGGIFSLLVGKPSEKEIIESKVEMAKSIVELKKVKLDYFVDLLEKIEGLTDAMYANFTLYNLLAILIASIGATSAVLMYKRMKLGFHAYVIYSFCAIIQVYAFVSPENVPSPLIIGNLIIAGLFVFMYYRNMSWLTK